MHLSSQGIVTEINEISGRVYCSLRIRVPKVNEDTNIPPQMENKIFYAYAEGVSGNYLKNVALESKIYFEGDMSIINSSDGQGGEKPRLAIKLRFIDILVVPEDMQEKKPEETQNSPSDLLN